MGSVDPISLP